MNIAKIQYTYIRDGVDNREEDDVAMIGETYESGELDRSYTIIVHIWLEPRPYPYRLVGSG